MKKESKVAILVLILSMSLWLCSTAFANPYSLYNTNSQKPYQAQDINHNGLYLGAGIGVEIPTGPDLDGFSTGGGWTIRIGYQFIRNLAVELGYHQGVGNASLNGVTGNWSFLEVPYLDVKPLIPLSSDSDLYFLVGITYVEDNAVISHPESVTATLGPNIGFDLGVGYEHYIGAHWSLGGEVIYHNLTSTKYSLSPGGSSTLPYAENGSSTSINFAFLYHF